MCVLILGGVQPAEVLEVPMQESDREAQQDPSSIRRSPLPDTL